MAYNLLLCNSFITFVVYNFDKIMKRRTVLDAFRFINGIKMNVVSDKETRAAIISNHLKMYKVAEEHEVELKKMYDKLFEDKEEDMQKLHALRGEFHTTESEERRGEIVKEISENYSEHISLENEFNEFFEKRLNEELDVELVKFDKEAFINACADSGIEFTMIDIAKVEELF